MHSRILRAVGMLFLSCGGCRGPLAPTSTPTAVAARPAIHATAVAFTVDNVAASARFLVDHFGFVQQMADPDGNVATLVRADVGASIIFVRRGNEHLPPDQRDRRADGVVLAFTVSDLDDEFRRLSASGVPIALPLTQEPWGERLFQVRDPNGVIIQLLAWTDAR